MPRKKYSPKELKKILSGRQSKTLFVNALREWLGLQPLYNKKNNPKIKS